MFDLKQFRKSNNLSQIELADILGLKSQSVISEYEKGIRPIPGDWIEKLSKYYNIGRI